MKVKVSGAEGQVLDWMVAKSEGHVVAVAAGGFVVFDTYQDDPPPTNEYNDSRWQCYSPSTNWAQGGPIIEREGICLDYWNDDDDLWKADMSGDNEQFGDTPLIAAMRCYVASKLGDEVEVPDELLE